MTTKKLTDTQLVILSAASRRDDRGVALPATLKGAAGRKVISTLLERGLIEEVRARGALPIWRRDEEAGNMSLRITKQGLASIALGDDESKAAGRKKANAPDQSKKDEGKSEKLSAPAPRKAQKQAGPASAPKSGSKQDTVIAMLRLPAGATIASIMAATGWQQHSVRAFLAGCVRKKLGLTLTSEKVDGERTYRIAPQPAAAAPAKTKKAA